MTCEVVGCDKPRRARGWCRAHYERWRTSGELGGGEVRPYGDPLAATLRNVEKTPGCWNWTASRCLGGYGRARVGGRTVQAHRWLYEQLVGPIPEGLDIDHLCRNRRCVNPDHLEPVTRSVNVQRGYDARKVGL